MEESTEGSGEAARDGLVLAMVLGGEEGGGLGRVGTWEVGSHWMPRTPQRRRMKSGMEMGAGLGMTRRSWNLA